MGGKPFSRGALFHLLRNRIYLGKIVHKNEVYSGEHQAIVDPDIFARVGGMLDANARRHQVAADRRVIKAPLTGKLFDASGAPMTPTFSRGRSGKVHRYYVSAALQQGFPRSHDSTSKRLPAAALEAILREALERWHPGSSEPWALISRVSVRPSGLNIELLVDGAALGGRLRDDERLQFDGRRRCSVFLPLAFPLRGGARFTVAGTRSSCQPDLNLIKALRKAHQIIERGADGGPICQAAPASPYDRKILRLAFLDPAIQRDILTGRQPVELNLETLMAMDIPLSWCAQRTTLNWPPA